jgi:large repetitive protein
MFILRNHLFNAFRATVLLICSIAAFAQTGGVFAGNGQSAPYSGDGGSAASAVISGPTGMAFDSSGNLYIAERGRIRKVDGLTKQINTVVEGAGLQAAGEESDYPYDVKLDAAGNLYWSDTAAHTVKKRHAITGVITTVAGRGTAGYSGDGGLAIEAELSLPTGLALDENGNIFVVDSGSHTLRRVDLITGVITTIAGNGTPGFSGDGGIALAARFDSPLGIAIDTSGNLYVSEMRNNRIRRIDISTGLIASIAGTGIAGYNGDGVAAVQANLRTPGLMTFDSAGNLIFADVLNNRVRMLEISSGLIWTVAGGRPLSLKAPAGVAISNPGTLLISESRGHVVRNVSLPAATVVTGLKLSTSLGRVPITVPVSLTAALATGNNVPGNATGVVNFFYGPTAEGLYGQLGTASLLNGEATLTTPLWDVGPWRINAEYLGDAAFAPTATSISGETGGQDLALTVTPLVKIGITPASPVSGESTAFTASLTPASQTGAIEFRDGETILGEAVVANGLATLSIAAPAAGVRSIGAVYRGDPIFGPVPSENLPVKVKRSAFAQLISSRNPSGQGSSVTFFALVAPAISNGTVAFYDNGVPIGNANVNPDFPGTSTFTTSSLGLGSHSITAKYGGDLDTGAATTAAVVQTVLGGATVSLLSNPAIPAPGQSVTYTAFVNPSSSTGLVQFFDGETFLGSGNLVSGTISISLASLPLGSHSVKAVYGGDANHSVASSNVILQSVLKKNITLTLASNLNPSVTGQAVQFTVNVNPATVTGTVQLINKGTSLGNITLRGGTASFVTSFLPAGTHSVQAVFSGDSQFNAGSSNVVTQQTKRATSVTISAMVNPGAAMILSAEVDPVAATGSVQFFDGLSLLGAGTLNGGKASLAISGLYSGHHLVKAFYLGDATHAANVSASSLVFVP